MFLAHPDLAEPVFGIGLEVQRGQVIQHQRQTALLGRVRVAGLRDHGAVVAFDHPPTRDEQRTDRQYLTPSIHLAVGMFRDGALGTNGLPGQRALLQ